MKTGLILLRGLVNKWIDMSCQLNYSVGSAICSTINAVLSFNFFTFGNVI